MTNVNSRPHTSPDQVVAIEEAWRATTRLVSVLSKADFSHDHREAKGALRSVEWVAGRMGVRLPPMPAQS